MNDNQPKPGTRAHLHATGGPDVVKLLSWLCILAACLLFWYGAFRLIVWAFTLPTVYVSYSTGYCVRVDDPQGVYSCENMPTKFNHQWVR